MALNTEEYMEWLEIADTDIESAIFLTQMHPSPFEIYKSDMEMAIKDAQKIKKLILSIIK